MLTPTHLIRSPKSQPCMRQRRGIAMLLVILSLTFATIVAVAYLASRDNVGMIGANVSAGSEARWTAESGAALGLGVLRSKTDWRNDHDNGVLYENLSIGGATVSITLTDMETGTAPKDSTQYVEMLVRSELEGLTRLVVIRALVKPWTDQSYDADLSEFAIFAISSLDVLDDAVIAAWGTSPSAKKNKSQINIGTTSTDASTIELGVNAVPLDVTVYEGPAASSYLVSNDSAYDVSVVGLGDDIVVPDPPDHGQAVPSAAMPVLALDAAAQTLAATTRYASGVLDNGADFILDDGATLIVDGDLTLANGSTMQVNGDTQMIVFGNVTINDSAIELMSGGRLRLFVRGDVTLDHAYIGDDPGAVDLMLDAHDNSSTAIWMPSSNLRIYGIDPASYSPGPSSPTWSLRNNSVMKASAYSPYASVAVEGDSGLYGRLLADAITLSSNGALYYDTAENQERGYTTESSFIFANDGTVRSEVKSMSNLANDSKTITHVVTAPIAEATVPVEILEVILSEEAARLSTTPTGPAAPPADPAALADDSRDAATTVSNLALAEFATSVFTAILAQKSAMQTDLNAAADAIEAGDYALAQTHLNNVISRVDGDGAVADWLRAGAAKTTLHTELTRIYTEVGNL